MTTLAPFLLIVATLFVQLSSGINYVTIPLTMSEQGYGNTLIGFAMSFEIIGILLLYRPLSSCVEKWGLVPSVLLMSALRASSLVLLSHSQNYPLWLLGIFCYGASTGMMLVIIQTSLNTCIQGKLKGLVMGLFSAALSGGLALGPLLLQLPYIDPEWQLETSALITSLPFVLLLLAGQNTQSSESSGTVRVRFALRHAKVILISAFVGGISFFGLPSFLTLYGMENALTESQSQLLLTMFMFGSVTLGIFVSTGASFLNRSIVVLGCIFTSVVCAVYLSLAVYTEYWLALTLLFFWGGSMGGIYAIGLTAVGERFCQQDQMSANMSYTIMDSLGGMTGLLVIGFMLDWMGSEGMTTVLITFGCALLVFFVYELLAPRQTFE
ncbi:MFS transporter [Vibrio nigripulchritudo]|uniref:MFS transporter n=1 Tax=Vibrio nigripulchritudo TaxID=28173 RepID=UPI002491B1AF|nr:MFS transporter [Vibrio nigripulchritudo]BDU35922.1 MFS transporter [Vibrio nigripulchritudo]BDU41594.1 MFS transporter [Vibrio nigripulchritudo]